MPCSMVWLRSMKACAIEMNSQQLFKSCKGSLSHGGGACAAIAKTRVERHRGGILQEAVEPDAAAVHGSCHGLRMQHELLRDATPLLQRMHHQAVDDSAGFAF